MLNRIEKIIKYAKAFQSLQKFKQKQNSRLRGSYNSIKLIHKGDPKDEVKFLNLEHLLSYPFMQNYINSPGFVKFSLDGNRMLQEVNNGFLWIVVGYIKYPERVDLPQWNGGKYIAKLNDGREFTLYGNQIVSCFDGLKLSSTEKVNIYDNNAC